MIKLRDYQKILIKCINNSWNEGHLNVMAVAPTGSGKTVIMSNLVNQDNISSICIAHRQELISQISKTLCINKIRHKIITNNKKLLASINSIHIFETGYSYINSNSKSMVGGVDTLIKMENDSIFNNVKLFICDEGHHNLRENKWGKVTSFFKNARGLLPTATPFRCDGKGLGRHADGIVDDVVFAPNLRQLINMGYLTDYRIHVPRSNFNRSNIKIGNNGEFTHDSVVKTTKDSKIIGDVVEYYLKVASGKLGITFAVDIEEAVKIASAFRSKSVPAEVITSDTPDFLRIKILDKFKNREILQLVNVDLFGEGFDLPALEVISMARPTRSCNLLDQMIGRVLRLMIPKEYQSKWDDYTDDQRKSIIASSNKPFGIIIDHVNNIDPTFGGLGLPDRGRELGLDRRDKRSSSKSTAIPLRICTNPTCCLAYERIFKKCPYCGAYAPEPNSRGSPEYVDGDLTELSQEYLAKLRGEIEASPKFPINATPAIIGAIRNRYAEKRDEREALVNTIAYWAGLQAAMGYDDSQSYRMFYFKYGVDVATCQTLSRAEMSDLRNRISMDLNKAGVNHE